MTFSHALSTNNYGVARFIVAISAANGTHTTLASAMAAASSGDTIFLRDSVTENVTLTAGVNIAAWSGTTGTPAIIGTLTMTTAGTCTISGIRLQTNSANLLAVTGSAASIVILNNCYLNCTNNTGISMTSSSASALIEINYCMGDLGTTGIGVYSSSSAGQINIRWTRFTNSGSSTTASSNSAGIVTFRNSNGTIPISSTSTGAVNLLSGCQLDTSSTNTTSLTANGTGGGSCIASTLISGTASTISIGVGVTYSLQDLVISSTNTNAVTGSGTVNYSLLNFTNTSNTVNTTTQGANITRYGTVVSNLQPAFLAYVNTTITNVTGDNTAYTIIFDTEVYDQTNNFNLGTSVFTAPVTGKYLFNLTVSLVGGTVISQAAVQIITTNRTYRVSMGLNPGLTTTAHATLSIVADMNATDTATFTVDSVDSGGKVDDVSGLVGGILRTFVSGNLIF